MFLEPSFIGQRSGWIEVICGSMFSGKTEELLRRLNRARIAGLKMEVFKPQVDSRFHEERVVSHDANEINSTPVNNSKLILNIASDVEVVAIDEAQFFDKDLPKVCQKLALQGVRVIIAGLDMDYKGIPFGPMPHLMAMAEYITKVHAICVHCGNLALHSYRKVSDADQVVLGAGETYEPRCRKCFEMGNIMDFKAAVQKGESPPTPGLFD
jgi:thymidine kinase